MVGIGRERITPECAKTLIKRDYSVAVGTGRDP